MSQPAPLPPSFSRKKATILSALSVPTESYQDLSPKNSIDVGIRDLIDEINGLDGFVTTSSCAGRVSVFLEGVKKARGVPAEENIGGDGGEFNNGESSDDNVGDEGREPTAKLAAAGGKGGGGRWLYVSHDPVDLSGLTEQSILSLMGMERTADLQSSNNQTPFEAERLIHFKFEPMILHVLTASLAHAQTLLTAGLSAGFRESGAINLLPASAGPATPLVAIRCMGLTLESVIGRLDASSGQTEAFVGPELLSGLLRVANERFEENERRIGRFRMLVAEGVKAGIGGAAADTRRGDAGGAWEDAGARRERMRAAGLKRAEALRAEAAKRATEDAESGTPSQVLG